jgi:outer membrane protein assembly factor BamB
LSPGTRIWDAVLPFTEEGDIGQGLLSANPSQLLENSINLVFIISPGVLIALDGVTGEPSWQWPIPSKNSLISVSGWNDFVGLMLQGEPIVSPYFPAIIRPTVLAALDANNGNLLWLQNATDVLPLSQADAATYAIENIEASREGLLYSRANKLNLIDWSSGDIIWETSVSLEGSVGTGQGANITHMSYLPRHELSDDGPDRILLNANNWGFQRFVLMQFNSTNSSGEILKLIDIV